MTFTFFDIISNLKVIKLRKLYILRKCWRKTVPWSCKHRTITLWFHALALILNVCSFWDDRMFEFSCWLSDYYQ